jgi:short-subunit dehydrogenase
MSGQLKKGLAGIITGASSGIGKALAILLANRYGANLIINARSETLLEETSRLVQKAGGRSICVPGDIADKELATRLSQECLHNFGDIDLLVNNAGFAKPGALTKLTPQDWEQVFAVNFFAALYGTYAVLPHFLKKQSGKIVNISSVAGKVSFPGSVCYAASKFALTGMSEGMACELACQGIDVLTVCPGWVRTDFFSKNKMMDSKNPTIIAQQKNLRGWLMRHYLSITSEQAAKEIVDALDKGGSGEIILTAPGYMMERFRAVFPSLAFHLCKRIPQSLVDSSIQN